MNGEELLEEIQRVQQEINQTKELITQLETMIVIYQQKGNALMVIQLTQALAAAEAELEDLQKEMQRLKSQLPGR